jgi:phosphohistidine phosphatase
VRAVQTAEVAVEELKYHGEVVRTEALVPHGSPEGVWKELRDYREESAILLAGHEPLLSSLVAYLLASPALRVEMKKAAMVRIDVDGYGLAPRGTLRWMITPKIAG